MINIKYVEFCDCESLLKLFFLRLLVKYFLDLVLVVIFFVKKKNDWCVNFMIFENKYNIFLKLMREYVEENLKFIVFFCV